MPELLGDVLPVLWNHLTEAEKHKLRILCSGIRALSDNAIAALTVAKLVAASDAKTLRRMLARCGTIQRLELAAECSAGMVHQVLHGLHLPGSLVEVTLVGSLTQPRPEMSSTEPSISPEAAQQLDLADLLCRACPSVRNLALDLPPQTYHLHSLLPCQHLQTLKLAVPPGATQHLHTISLLTQLTALHLLDSEDLIPEDASYPTAPTHPVQPEAGTTAPATPLPVPSTTGPTGLHWLCPLTQLRALELKTWGLIQQHKDLLDLACLTQLTCLRYGEGLLGEWSMEEDEEPGSNPWTEVLCQLLPCLTRLMQIKLVPEAMLDSRLLDRLAGLPKLSILKAYKLNMGRAELTAAGAAVSQLGRAEPCLPSLTSFTIGGNGWCLEDLHFVAQHAPNAVIECMASIIIKAPLQDARGRAMLAELCTQLRQATYHVLSLRFEYIAHEVPVGPWLEAIRPQGLLQEHRVTSLCLTGVYITQEDAQNLVADFPSLSQFRLRDALVGVKTLLELSKLPMLRYLAMDEDCIGVSKMEMAMFMGARQDVALEMSVQGIHAGDWAWLCDLQASLKPQLVEAEPGQEAEDAME